MSHIRAVIVSLIFYIAAVSSINLSDFNDKNYPRICTLDRYNPDEICRKIANLPTVKFSAYSRIDENVSGECKKISVKLYNDYAGKDARVDATIVLCDIGENYKKCASASTEDDVVEHYDYKSSRGSYRCVHTGSINI